MRVILADTTPLYASVDPSDQYHAQAQAELGQINQENIAVLIPYPVYLETHRLLLYRLGFSLALSFAERLLRDANFVNPNPEDYQTALTLLSQFPDQQITLTDAVTAVLAKQVNLPVWTYDFHFDVLQVPVWR